MVHHVARHLARRRDDGEERLALLVLDGLSLDQWVTLREALSGQRPNLRFHQEALFAWIPTITPVSRQAIFAGQPPVFFPASIGSTDAEPRLWARFWLDRGLALPAVTYLNQAGDAGELEEIGERLSDPALRVVEIVVRKVDEVAHGMQLGRAGMHNQVRQWAAQGFMAGLLDQLFERGFGVLLTADHGNVEAEGIGRPAEGVLADERGQRARIYPDSLLRAKVKEQFPDAIEWSPIGLPEGYFPLLAPDRAAFTAKGACAITHGGLSLDEVIVPFIRIERSET
jgi:hypothetical protein